MNVFIDTNIYLTFYHFTRDALEELKKLLTAIENSKIVLFLPEQVIVEFKRNRETKIADALKRFREQNLPNEFPQICKEYKEYKDLNDAAKRFGIAKDILLQKVNDDVQKNTLKADSIINQLFSKATKLSIPEAIYTRAKRRVEIGNPPGKNDSLGDALNWESLLENAPKLKPLFVITDDKDYRSPINDRRLSEFLIEEWARNKTAEIYYYKNLTDFFAENFPDIKLASDLEKQIAIAELMASPNFGTTHRVIDKLSKLGEFSNKEINEIVEAGINNNQVYWIKNDPDIKSFFSKLLKGRENVVDLERLVKFKALFENNEEGSVMEHYELPY